MKQKRELDSVTIRLANIPDIAWADMNISHICTDVRELTCCFRAYPNLKKP